MRTPEPFEFGEGSRAVLFLHGFSSTPMELRALASAASGQGFYCRGLLHPGHGKNLREFSQFKWIRALEHARNNLEELLDQYDSVSLVGLSFGGLLSLELAKHYPVEKMVLLAPFIHESNQAAPLREWAVKNLPLEWLIPYTRKNRDSSMLDLSAREKHLHFEKLPLTAVRELFLASESINQYLSRIKCPALLIHSLTDRTSAFENSVHILKEIGSTQKTLIALNQSDHIITLDYEKDRVESLTLNFLNSDN